MEDNSIKFQSVADGRFVSWADEKIKVSVVAIDDFDVLHIFGFKELFYFEVLFVKVVFKASNDDPDSLVNTVKIFKLVSTRIDKR